MPFEIVRNDIANMQVDAIVNSVDRKPCVNSGVDWAIHRKAGPELLQAREALGYIYPGGAAITPAFSLDAEYVIHAVAPLWKDGSYREEELLREVYDRCLDLAWQNHCESIAFPLLASGNQGFPKDRALQVAIGAFSSFLMEHEMQIYLVVFGDESLRLSEKLVQNVRCYIDAHYVSDYVAKSPVRQRNSDWDDYCAGEMMAEAPCIAPCAKATMSLQEFIKQKDAGFSETLLSLIQAKGVKNSAIYKKANISKQHFSKIINDPNAKPSKPTAIALALALELNLAETRDLIGRAGYALTNSSTFDLIIRYFIEHKRYDVIEINIALYEFDQSLLGA